MSRNFDSLNGVEPHGVPGQNNPADVRVAPDCAAILADELAQIEKIVGDSLGKLKSVVIEGADAVRKEKDQAAQTIEALKAEAFSRESRLRETERMLHSRDQEVTDLGLKLQLLAKQIASLQQSLEQTKCDAASAVEGAALEVANAKAKTAALEARVAETEASLRAKEAASTQFEQTASVKIAQLENQLKDKQTLLTDSYQQSVALRSEVTRLKAGIEQIASRFSQQIEALTGNLETGRQPLATAEQTAALGEPAIHSPGSAAVAPLLER